MNTCLVRFCCPSCAARIKAPGQLTGQRRNCPRCGREFTVPRQVREDVGPILVLSDAAPAYLPRAAYRRGA